jgi:hypothetical protein
MIVITGTYTTSCDICILIFANGKKRASNSVLRRFIWWCHAKVGRWQLDTYQQSEGGGIIMLIHSNKKNERKEEKWTKGRRWLKQWNENLPSHLWGAGQGQNRTKKKEFPEHFFVCGKTNRFLAMVRRMRDTWKCALTGKKNFNYYRASSSFMFHFVILPSLYFFCAPFILCHNELCKFCAKRKLKQSFIILEWEKKNMQTWMNFTQLPSCFNWIVTL